MNKTTKWQLLFECQAHAFAHLLDGPQHVALAMCPLCLGVFGRNEVVSLNGAEPDVTIEHGPPKHRTRLGPARGICLTHHACNGRNGYESRSGKYRADLSRLARGEEAALFVEVDRRRELIRLVGDSSGVHPVDPALMKREIRISTTDLPFDAQLTELKAAYLIAFVVLGYSWASSAALDQIRKVIQTGDITAIRHIPLFVMNNPDPEMANTVMVSDDSNLVVVIGENAMFGALLPSATNDHWVSERGAVVRVGGVAQPWPENEWWLKPDLRSTTFRSDCDVTRPMWRVQFDDPHIGRMAKGMTDRLSDALSIR